METNDDVFNSGDVGETRRESQPKLPVYINLASFVSKKNIIHFIYCIMTVFTIITLYCSLSMVTMVKEIVHIKQERLNNLVNLAHKLNPQNLCLSIECIMYNSNSTNIKHATNGAWHNKNAQPLPDEFVTDVLNSSNGLFPKYTAVSITVNKLDTQDAPGTSIVFYISNLQYLNLGSSIIKDSLVISILFIIILYVTVIYFIEKNTVYEKHNYKYTVENKLQRNITESLYHEMINPLSVIDTIIKDIYATVYGDSYDKYNDKITFNEDRCELELKEVSCKGCKKCPLTKINYKDLLKNLDSYHPAISSSINRLFATINLVSGVKKIKYSNGSVPIYTIIENAISSANLLSVNKLKYTIENPEILNVYSVSGKLNNGDLLNILTIMITNSLEAYSDRITISADLKVNKLILHVKDNGRGIRDSHDKIITNINIFNYGSSSKDPNLKKSLLEKMLNFISLSFEQKQTTRGVGLFLNKELLKKCDGDILLESTSSKGTQFDIILPVKKTEKKV